MTSSSPDPGAMDLEAIRQAIDSGDTRQRMRAITAMQPHEVGPHIQKKTKGVCGTWPKRGFGFRVGCIWFQNFWD